MNILYDIRSVRLYVRMYVQIYSTSSGQDGRKSTGQNLHDIHSIISYPSSTEKLVSFLGLKWRSKVRRISTNRKNRKLEFEFEMALHFRRGCGGDREGF